MSGTPSLFLLNIGQNDDNPKEYLSSGRILVGAPDGRELKTILEHQHMPDGIQVCTESRKIFWTNMGTPGEDDGGIFVANIDGSDMQQIVGEGNINTPKQCKLDQSDKKIYFCDREGMRVMRCSYDGSHLETLVKTGDLQNASHKDDLTRHCVGIAIAHGKVYWTQKGPSKGGKGRIFRADVDTPAGKDATSRDDIELLFTGLPEPIDLEVDTQSNILYWTDRGEVPVGNTLNRVAIERLNVTEETAKSVPGKDYEVIGRNLHEGIGLAIDEKNGYIYTSEIGGTVHRFDLDGKNKKVVYDGDVAFTGIALARI